jgi:hypothetical protein
VSTRYDTASDSGHFPLFQLRVFVGDAISLLQRLLVLHHDSVAIPNKDCFFAETSNECPQVLSRLPCETPCAYACVHGSL